MGFLFKSTLAEWNAQTVPHELQSVSETAWALDWIF